MSPDRAAPGQHHAVPPKAGPDAGDNPGYAEDKPRDRGDVRAPHGRDDPPSPEEGGVGRAPDGTASGAD